MFLSLKGTFFSKREKGGRGKKGKRDENEIEIKRASSFVVTDTFYCGTRVASGAWQHWRCLERCNRAITVSTSLPLSPPHPSLPCGGVWRHGWKLSLREPSRQLSRAFHDCNLQPSGNGLGEGVGDYSTNHLVTFNYRSCFPPPASPLNPANLPNPRKRGRVSSFLPSPKVYVHTYIYACFIWKK